MPITCLVKGCGRQLSGYGYLERHTRPAHGLCADCAMRNASRCTCHEDRMAEQADRGTYVRITLTNRKTLLLEDLRGDPERDAFVSGEGVNPDCSSRWTTHVISTRAIKKVQPLAYNLITGLLENEIMPRQPGRAARGGRRR